MIVLPPVLADLTKQSQRLRYLGTHDGGPDALFVLVRPILLHRISL